VAHRGRVHLHSGAASGPGWKRVLDDPIDPAATPHGDIRPDPDPNYSAFNPKCVDSNTEKELKPDLSAPYGHRPDGTRYTEKEYAVRFLIVGGDGIAWPPNEGAVAGRKLDYADAGKFVGDFGTGVDRLGEPKGVFFGLMENGHPSYEERALHYRSLYQKLHTYPLNEKKLQDKLVKDWKIRVMETAPALGQLGGRCR